uniref:hypothetical protein n=1 Tax=Carnobacterium sp. TaxID=48221 RepID=UPI001598F2F7|nr:hypothetical protein [Carnobacterium sp.]QJS06070.1 hypothetical protein [Carnobacterium sp.]
MKRKAILIFGITGVLALSIGFKDVLAKEPSFSQKDEVTVITVDEQNNVEKSAKLSGFVPQENGTGFFFAKVK